MNGPIPLSFRTIPRRLGIGAGESLDEDDLLLRDSHIAVLGDAGAGKTTTLRRIAGMIATTPSFSDLFDRVVLVVCRESHQRKQSLRDELANAVGISAKLAADLDQPWPVVINLLEGTLILIDGLDELPAVKRERFEVDLAWLARSVHAKIIVSSRSPDWVPIAGFEVAEIQPLTVTQIAKLVGSVFDADNADRFIEAISREESIRELANRPLLLVYMARLYQLRGTIPERPSDLLRAIVLLLVREWDEQRRVRRQSAFTHFDDDAKLAFLGELSWRLLEASLTLFSMDDFNRVYRRLFEKFGLPPNPRAVFREIEAHNSLIVEAGGNYEFSHRTLQEFLAAEFIIRSFELTANVLMQQPAVAAVAVSLSTDAALAIRALAHDVRDGQSTAFAVRSFLARLASEHPRLAPTDKVGVALLWMIRLAHYKDGRPLAALQKCEPLRKSIILGIQSFADRGYRPGQRVYLSIDLVFDQSTLEAAIGSENLRQAMPPRATD